MNDRKDHFAKRIAKLQRKQELARPLSLDELVRDHDDLLLGDWLSGDLG